jgi:hypothetical protein
MARAASPAVISKDWSAVVDVQVLNDEIHRISRVMGYDTRNGAKSKVLYIRFGDLGRVMEKYLQVLIKRKSDMRPGIAAKALCESVFIDVKAAGIPPGFLQDFLQFNPGDGSGQDRAMKVAAAALSVNYGRLRSEFSNPSAAGVALVLPMVRAEVQKFPIMVKHVDQIMKPWLYEHFNVSGDQQFGKGPLGIILTALAAEEVTSLPPLYCDEASYVRWRQGDQAVFPHSDDSAIVFPGFIFVMKIQKVFGSLFMDRYVSDNFI